VHEKIDEMYYTEIYGQGLIMQEKNAGTKLLRISCDLLQLFMQERKKDRTKEHIEIRAREAQIQNIQNANVDAHYHIILNLRCGALKHTIVFFYVIALS
jgi:hypothetical protein